MSKPSLQEVKCPKTHRLTPQPTVLTTAKYGALTVTRKSSHVHTCSHTHMSTHSVSWTLAHSHTLRRPRLSSHHLGQVFNYTTPTPVINPPTPFQGRCLDPLPKGWCQGRGAKMSTSGREDLGTRVTQCGCLVSRSRRVKKRMG